MPFWSFGGTVNTRNTASQAAKNKTARTQFKPTHQLVRLVISSGLIAVTPSPSSFMMFGINQTNVNPTTRRIKTVPAIRHLRCSGRVFKPESKVAIANKLVSGIMNAQNLPP